jgi:hypothetical protein
VEGAVLGVVVAGGEIQPVTARASNTATIANVFWSLEGAIARIDAPTPILIPVAIVAIFIIKEPILMQYIFKAIARRLWIEFDNFSPLSSEWFLCPLPRGKHQSISSVIPLIAPYLF